MLIENAIFFGTQAKARKTIFTIFAVVKKVAVSGIMGFFARHQIVRTRAVNTFHTERAFVTVEAFGTVRTAVDGVRIVAILVVIAYENHVTIFVLLCAVGVIAVFIAGGEHGGFGGVEHELFELIKKRTIEIKIAAVLHGIPFVCEPFVLIVDFIRRIRGINGNDLLAC